MSIKNLARSVFPETPSRYHPRSRRHESNSRPGPKRIHKCHWTSPPTSPQLLIVSNGPLVLTLCSRKKNQEKSKSILLGSITSDPEGSHLLLCLTWSVLLRRGMKTHITTLHPINFYWGEKPCDRRWGNWLNITITSYLWLFSCLTVDMKSKTITVFNNERNWPQFHYEEGNFAKMHP